MKKIFLLFALTILLSVALIALAITGDTVKDPVCGMEVEIENAPVKIEGAKGTIYFCSQPCKDKFLADPTAYLDQEKLDKMGVTLTVGEKVPCSGKSLQESTTSVQEKTVSSEGCAGCVKAAASTEAGAADQLGCDGNCGIEAKGVICP